MPGLPVLVPVTAAVFATLVANNWPNGTIFAITDDVPNEMYEARGADGARVFVQIGGGGTIALDDLTDVDVSTTPPTDLQALVYDAGTATWVPGTVSTGGGEVRVIETAYVDDTTGDVGFRWGIDIFDRPYFDPNAAITDADAARLILPADGRPAVEGLGL